MSHENVELAHRAYEALNRRDLGAFLALMDPDAEAVSLLVEMEGDFRGHAGIRRYWENLLDTFPDLAVEVVEVRDCGDLTLATLRIRGHGADSDTPFETPLWQLGEWRDGKLVRWRSYASDSEAREALATSE